MRAVCSGTRGRGCCGWSDMVKPPAITAPTPLSTLRLTHSPTVSGVQNGTVYPERKTNPDRLAALSGRQRLKPAPLRVLPVPSLCADCLPWLLLSGGGRSRIGLVQEDFCQD